jgi:hypothetical protein
VGPTINASHLLPTVSNLASKKLLNKHAARTHSQRETILILKTNEQVTKAESRTRPVSARVPALSGTSKMDLALVPALSGLSKMDPARVPALSGLSKMDQARVPALSCSTHFTIPTH